jgi:hypothetical protein
MSANNKRMRYGSAALLLVCFLVRLTLAQAHEIRPAYLDLNASDKTQLRIFWRQPIAGEYAAPLSPAISTDWLRRSPYASGRSESAYFAEWRVPAPYAELAGATVHIEGLPRTITDVLLHITYSDGTELTQLLTPSSPEFRIPAAAKAGLPVREYLELGFTHIWGGLDHLLYVFGLLLLVRDFRTLVKTITAFTAAHSITLAAAALGYVHVPPAPVEAVIALSIVFVAAEVLNVRAGEASLARRNPWVVAFCFGLLHGLGFAGALADVGLPPRAIPVALLLFNVGIEIGQLAFVGSLLLAAKALWRWSPRLTLRVRRISPYAIGAIASFWLIERVGAIF